MKILIKESQLKHIVESMEVDDTKYDVIFVGGLESGMNLSQQSSIFKSGFGYSTNVKSFSYRTPTSQILDFLKEQPKTPIYLFSKSCEKAATLSSSNLVNNKELYIIEPYSQSITTKNIVLSAISNGVPLSNVFVGPNSGRGSNISGASKTPKNLNHFDSLKYVSNATSILSEELNLKKNTWTPLTKDDVESLKDDVFRLINNAYAEIGGHTNIKSPDDISIEGDYFDVIDLDDDPDVDSVTVAKDKPSGKKFVAIGHDGSRLAKSSVINHQASLLKKSKYYVEASGKVADIFLAKGLTPITDEDVVKTTLKGKDIEWIGDGKYRRVIGGEPRIKLLFGRPRKVNS